MGRPLLLALVVLALLPAAAGADAYAPSGRAGPPLSVAPAVMAKALECSAGIDHATKTPVLLVPGTGSTAHDNFGFNYEPALDQRGQPWCAVTFPFSGNGYIPVNGEYVVYAIRTMFARAGRRISIAGHSQGGMVPRWALRFWPDTRPMVEDMIGFAPSNHGSTAGSGKCANGASCIEADWQQAYQSNFIRALNSGAETFAPVSYTSIYSRRDEIVTPNADDTGSSSLHGGAGRITNVAIQDICPADASEHFLIGTIDAPAYALAVDALDHDGPADRSRISSGVCAQPFMPGVNPVTGPVAGLQGLYADESSSGPETTSEPPLPCYVYASCAIPGTNGSASRPRPQARRRHRHRRHRRAGRHRPVHRRAGPPRDRF